MGPTIIDIAKEAGVSKSTVSLVLNNKDNVKLETRYRVMEAVKKLGYVPNMAARELSTKKKHVLGLVFLTQNISVKPYSFDGIVETLLYDTSPGIYDGLKDTDYTLLTERFPTDTNQLPELVKNRRVDGIFLIGGLYRPDLIDQIVEQDVRTVIIGRQEPLLDSVAVDTEQVGYLAASYLLEKGHRRIAFLNGPRDSEISRQKKEGFFRAFAQANLEPPAHLLRYGPYTGRGGYENMRSVWEERERPTAVFGGSDGITQGARRFLNEVGASVPGQVSLLGYEDSILAEYSSPALTVIDAAKERMGLMACEILLKRIQTPNRKIVSIKTQPALLERDSVRQI